MDKQSQKRAVVQYVKIDDASEDQRIDNFLIKKLKNVPKTHIYRILRKGEVRVNKKRVKQTYRLQFGDEVRIPPVVYSQRDVKIDPAKFEYLNDRVVFEDDDILVLNKPHGLAVHGGSKTAGGLIEAMRLLRPKLKSLELAHRLDKETSGLLILAKKRSVLKKLHEMLREKQVNKTYHAVVVGRWPKNLNKVDRPVQAKADRAAQSEPKESVTTFQVIEPREGTTLVECKPHTGRTHQIRIHCQQMRHPIVGDDKYGDEAFDEKHKPGRMFLHAVRLKFEHPVTGEILNLVAESGF